MTLKVTYVKDNPYVVLNKIKKPYSTLNRLKS